MAVVTKTVKDWFANANEDLRAAIVLHQIDPKQYLRTVPYHCQQAAEKSIKGFMAFHKIGFKKDHDLGYLAKLILPSHPELSEILLLADELTDFAIIFRYPDAAKREPALEDSEFALRVAKQVFDKMASLIPFDSSFKF